MSPSFVLSPLTLGKMDNAGRRTGVTEKAVGELRARTTWPRGLVVITPREPRPEAVVKISVAN